MKSSMIQKDTSPLSAGCGLRSGTPRTWRCCGHSNDRGKTLWTVMGGSDTRRRERQRAWITNRNKEMRNHHAHSIKEAARDSGGKSKANYHTGPRACPGSHVGLTTPRWLRTTSLPASPSGSTHSSGSCVTERSHLWPRGKGARALVVGFTAGQLSSFTVTYLLSISASVKMGCRVAPHTVAGVETAPALCVSVAHPLIQCHPSLPGFPVIS